VAASIAATRPPAVAAAPAGGLVATVSRASGPPAPGWTAYAPLRTP
jgi:heme/copper-type cytochrome/quinol oxidase subunit 1